MWEWGELSPVTFHMLFLYDMLQHMCTYTRKFVYPFHIPVVFWDPFVHTLKCQYSLILPTLRVP